MRLGCVTAAGLEPGPSTTMAFDGQLLNRPSEPSGERAVSNALFVYYYGVYAPAPSQPVLSPNGDRVGDSESLSYKVVRPSTVTASIVGPDGNARFSQTVQQGPGTYKFSYAGTKPDGSAEAEGKWHWTVTALDDLGRRSTADQPFWLNNTLGFLQVPSNAVVGGRRRLTVARFALTHPAKVTTRIESQSGLLIRRLGKANLRPGTLRVRWDGRDQRKHLVYGGRYVLRVRAVSQFGPTELTRTFRVRRG